MPEQPILSVSELNQYARGVLEMHVGKVSVSGEISNFSCPASGHWYFTLKDSRAQIRCAMFRNKNRFIRIRPEQGMQLIVHGAVSLYEGRGDYQLIADYIEEAGLGALQRRFEQLKQQLAAEGLFAQQHKKPLPRHVSHIAVITSPTGAAIHDILTVLEKRFPLLKVTLIPAAVQGQQATRELCAALALAERWNRQRHDDPFDAVIIGRGGGSLEDLWPFNEENVARAIYASTLPVISAVGHETDTSISDFVADARAATPSAAAQMISPDRQALQQQLDHLEATLASRITAQLHRRQTQLNSLKHALQHPGQILANYQLQFQQLGRQLQQLQQQQLERCRHRLELASRQLHGFQPEQQLANAQNRLQQLNQAMADGMQALLAERRRQLNTQAQLLDTVSPLATLRRGYSITSDDKQQVIRDIHTLQVGDTIHTRLSHGTVTSTVKKLEKSS